MSFTAVEPIDFAFTQFIQSLSSPALDLFMQAVSLLGNPATWFLIAAFLFWSGKEKESFYLANIVLFAALFTAAIKDLIQRPRPSAEQFKVQGELFQESIESSYSYSSGFPSGHATLISAVTVFYHKTIEKKLKILLFAAAFLVIISRIYLGQHFLSDVIAGAFLGALIGKADSLFREKTLGKDLGGEIRHHPVIWGAVIASMALLFILSNSSIFYPLLGFYAGIFALKELKIENRGSVKKLLIGFPVLFILVFSAMKFDSSILLFLSGVWVTFFNPLLFKLFFKDN